MAPHLPHHRGCRPLRGGLCAGEGLGGDGVYGAELWMRSLALGPLAGEDP
jgi:hypothetical protein